MSSKIVAAVPNSLLTQKSRSGSRSKSGKGGHGQQQQQLHGNTEQMSHSKSLAANRGILGMGGGGGSHSGTNVSAATNEHGIQSNSHNIQFRGRVGGLAMASISSHNLATNKSNELNRRISQSPYSFQARFNNQINVSPRHSNDRLLSDR